jgi:hypothetical protein
MFLPQGCENENYDELNQVVEKKPIEYSICLI